MSKSLVETIVSELDRLISLARKVKMTPTESEQQRKSFAYGNSSFENPLITKEMIDREAEKLDKSK